MQFIIFVIVPVCEFNLKVDHVCFKSNCFEPTTESYFISDTLTVGQFHKKQPKFTTFYFEPFSDQIAFSKLVLIISFWLSVLCNYKLYFSKTKKIKCINFFKEKYKLCSVPYYNPTFLTLNFEVFGKLGRDKKL